jgi:hypothetical protein
MKRFALILVVAILVPIANSYADTLQVGSNYPSFNYSFTKNGVTTSGYLGSGSIDPSYLNGVALPFLFCTQIDVDIWVGRSYDQTAVNNSGSGINNAAQVAFLLEHYAHAGMSSIEMTALQAAIWTEIYMGTGITFNILDTNGSDFNADYARYMSGIGAGDVTKFTWLNPADANGQYQTLVTSVPEPSLILLLGIGFGAVSLVSLRKKN